MPIQPGAPQAIEFDVGVARFGLRHQPPFVAAGKVLVDGRVHEAWLRAMGRVRIPTDLLPCEHWTHRLPLSFLLVHLLSKNLPPKL